MGILDKLTSKLSDEEMSSAESISPDVTDEAIEEEWVVTTDAHIEPSAPQAPSESAVQPETHAQSAPEAQNVPESADATSEFEAQRAYQTGQAKPADAKVTQPSASAESATPPLEQRNPMDIMGAVGEMMATMHSPAFTSKTEVEMKPAKPHEQKQESASQTKTAQKSAQAHKKSAGATKKSAPVTKKRADVAKKAATTTKKAHTKPKSKKKQTSQKSARQVAQMLKEREVFDLMNFKQTKQVRCEATNLITQTTLLKERMERVSYDLGLLIEEMTLKENPSHEAETYLSQNAERDLADLAHAIEVFKTEGLLEAVTAYDVKP